jgi:hypothetical protein
MFTHRVRVTMVADVDDELTGWIRSAYDRAGCMTYGQPAVPDDGGSP